MGVKARLGCRNGLFDCPSAADIDMGCHKTMQAVLDQHLRTAGGPPARMIEVNRNIQPRRAIHNVGEFLVERRACEIIDALSRRFVLNGVKAGSERLNFDTAKALAP